jgi:hypothetical protein
MFSFRYPSNTTSSVPTVRSRRLRKRPLACEPLESRCLLSTAVWTGAAGDGLWSNPANWQGDVIPAVGADVQFPATGQRAAETVVLGQEAEVGDLTIGPSYTLRGSTITVDGSLSADGIDTIASNLVDAGLIDVGTSQYDTSATLTVTGSFTGSGSVSLNPEPPSSVLPNGTLKIEGPTSNLGRIYFYDGTLDAETALDGNVFIADSDLGDGILEGNCSVQGIVVANTGSVNLFNGNKTDTITSNGNTSLADLKELITGSNSAGQLIVTGSGSPVGASEIDVTVAEGVPTPYGSVYTVIKNETGHAAGQIFGLPEGSTFTTSQGITYRISYHGGASGEDVTLTILPPKVSAVSPAHASPNTVAEASTVLTALGDTPVGASGLTYRWAVVASPPGARAPRFSANGTSAARRSVVTFSKAGYYRLRCTISYGQGDTAATDVSIRVQQTATSLRIEPHNAKVAEDGALQFAGTVLDQFNHPMRTAQTLMFVVESGPGSITPTGLFSATSITGQVEIELEADDLTGTVSAVVE